GNRGQEGRLAGARPVHGGRLAAHQDHGPLRVKVLAGDGELHRLADGERLRLDGAEARRERRIRYGERGTLERVHAVRAVDHDAGGSRDGILRDGHLEPASVRARGDALRLEVGDAAALTGEKDAVARRRRVEIAPPHADAETATGLGREEVLHRGQPVVLASGAAGRLVSAGPPLVPGSRPVSAGWILTAGGRGPGDCANDDEQRAQATHVSLPGSEEETCSGMEPAPSRVPRAHAPRRALQNSLPSNWASRSTMAPPTIEV